MLGSGLVFGSPLSRVATVMAAEACVDAVNERGAGVGAGLAASVDRDGE